MEMVGASAARAGTGVGAGVSVASGVGVVVGAAMVGVRVGAVGEAGVKGETVGNGVSVTSRHGPVASTEQSGKGVATFSTGVGARSGLTAVKVATEVVIEETGAGWAVITITCNVGGGAQAAKLTMQRSMANFELKAKCM